MPVECAGCDTYDRGLCEACVAALVPQPTPRMTVGGLEVLTALRYEGRVRRIILAFKEQHRTDVTAALSRPLGITLGESLAAASARRSLDCSVVEVVAVPTSRAAYRRRGYDPVADLVRRAGFRPARVLAPTRRTAAQKSLGTADRAANLRGAMIARRSLTGRVFVLADDVLTTGATLDEAARALRAAGGEVVAAATVAFTPRMFPSRDNPSHEDYGGAKGAG